MVDVEANLLIRPILHTEESVPAKHGSSLAFKLTINHPPSQTSLQWPSMLSETGNLLDLGYRVSSSMKV